MKYEAIQYNDRTEALAAFRKMIERKRQWIEKTERDFEKLATYRQNLAKA